MTIAMTSLKKAANGDYLSRKAIPADVRDAYQKAHGVSREERFRRPASMPVERAKQEMREWDATISGRIEALRAASRGEGRSLTQREAHALAGEWYRWFVAQHEEEPGTAEGWEIERERLQSAYERYAPDDPDPDADITVTPAERRHVRAVLTELARVPTFLSEHSHSLTPDALNLLLDTVQGDYVAALGVLSRRAEGDYGKDERPLRFPKVHWQGQGRAAGLGCWGLFEAWVAERKPGPATVNRWRSVFLALEDRFKGRDVATITNEEAIEWKGSLVTEERSARVANEVWLTAARTVFAWALVNKKVPANPFDGVAVSGATKAVETRERELRQSEWQTILTAALAPPPPRMSSHNARARRWVPWLCAYTGARPGEMTQLRAQDVQQHDSGPWVIRITPEAGTQKGRRARWVPIHEHLIEQGFIKMAQAEGSGPLFYDPDGRRVKDDDPLKPVRPPWVKAREKLADWVRSIGVSDKGISPNHAWRHTFKRRASRAKIERHIRDAIVGHKLRDVADQYEAPTVEDMAAALAKFPRYELSRLVPSKPAGTASAGRTEAV
jgi:integrase